MQKNLAQISFSELLSANEAEMQKWRAWFERQPAAVLEVPLSIALAKNVREFLLHIFAVELRYASGCRVCQLRTMKLCRRAVSRNCSGLENARGRCMATTSLPRPTKTLR